jgi:DNA-binding PadR family transcriptional regulator
MRQPKDPSALLPLGASAFQILLSLAEGERHGYSVGKAIEAATSGATRLRPGSLYRLLKQMAADGWIVETETESDGDRRRYYRLTPWGRRIAQAEAERLRELVRLALSYNLLSVAT